MKTMGGIGQDSVGRQIQAFISDPAKCLGTVPAGTVLKVGPGGWHDISGWLAVAFYPADDGQVAYNGDVAKVEPVFSGARNVIVIHADVTQIVASVDCVVVGM